MARKIGYFLEGLENGYDEIIVEKMKAFGCDQILMESACDAFRRIVWERLERAIREDDLLVCPSLLHLATDGRMCNDILKRYEGKGIKMFVFDGFRPQDSISEVDGLHALYIALKIPVGHKMRQGIVLGRMRKLCMRQFPDVKPRVLDLILLSRCLQFCVPENEMAYMTDFGYTQDFKRTRDWLKGDYKKDLKGRDRDVFENEFYGDRKHSSSWWTCV